MQQNDISMKRENLEEILPLMALTIVQQVDPIERKVR